MKSPDKLNMLAMFDDIPALKDVPGFRDIVNRVPDDIDYEAPDEESTLYVEAMLMEQEDPEDWWEKPAAAAVVTATPPSAASTSSKSRPTSIRIPGTVLAKLKATALAQGIGYQTLINRVLKASVSGS